MTELGVSDEQFMEACQRAESNPIHKKIVDQIMAVDNFLAFKKLMVKRNAELEKQTAEYMEKMASKKAGTEIPKEEQKATSGDQQNSSVTVAAAGNSTNANSSSQQAQPKEAQELRKVIKVAHDLDREEEEAMLRRAITESENQAAEQKKIADQEEELIRQAIEMSQKEEQDRLQRQKTTPNTTTSFKEEVKEESVTVSAAIVASDPNVDKNKKALSDKEAELKKLIQEKKRKE